jgi:hypothetical protein
MIDFSFLPLKPSFSEAINALGDPNISNFNYHNIVIINPLEGCLQISNSPINIAFNGDFEVEVVNCRQESIANITANTYIREFTDQNGIIQICWEIKNLAVDFGQEVVFLKFTHTTGSEVWYTTTVLITKDYIEETSRFEYKSFRVFQGTDYVRADSMQRIRIKAYYDRPSDETEIKSYFQITNGQEVSAQAIIKSSEIYKLDYVTPFVFKRMNVLLVHDVVYIDGVRVTDKNTLKSNERIGQTNLMRSEFQCSKNENDIYVKLPDFSDVDFTDDFSIT